MSDVKKIVNKILEGDDVRTTLSDFKKVFESEDIPITDDELASLTKFVNDEWEKNPLSKFFNIYVERSSRSPSFVTVDLDEKEKSINPLMDALKDAILKEFGDLKFSTFQGPEYADGGWVHKAIEFRKFED